MKRILFLVILFTSQLVYGQFKSTKLKMAEGLYEEEKFYASLRVYYDIAKDEDENKYVIERIAALNHQLGNLEEAKKWYSELMQVRQTEFPKTQYKYAQVLMQLGEYEKAQQEFTAFIKAYRGFDKADISKHCKNSIKGCKKALSKKVNPNFSVSKLPRQINSAYNDLAPFPVGDTLLYFSSVKADSAILYKEFLDSVPTFNIYAIKRNNEKWDTIAKEYMADVLNEKYKHSANGTFSEDGKTFLFTRCKMNVNGKNICKIYGVQRKDNKWGSPIKLSGEINDPNNDFSSTHPNLTVDKKSGKLLLFFVSNMPGGNGGYDIWKTLLDPQLNPVKIENVGKRINTKQDELTPYYYAPENALYFSSNGKIGYGGFDIYKSQAKGRRNRLGKPIHLDRPINSSKNDWYYAKMNKKEAFLVSNRKGSTPYYKTDVLDDIFLVKEEPKKYLRINTFANDSSKTPLVGSLIKFKEAKDLNSDGEIIREGNVKRIVPETSYYILVQKNGYINKSKLYSIKWEEKKDTIDLAFILDKIDTNKVFTFANIYFDFDSEKLKKESDEALEKLYNTLIENPQLVVEIGAHTDSKGGKKYNMELSSKRAQSVCNYLINKGIGTKRLVPVGYGSGQPVSKDESEKNRRVTVKILTDLSTQNEK